MHLRQQTSIIEAALASSTAPSSASATDAVDINISTRYGKQKSCCFHRDVIIRRLTAVSCTDDDARCLQVTNTGPTAICKRISTQRASLQVANTGPTAICKRISTQRACLQVANTGPTASCKRISTQRACLQVTNTGPTTICKRISTQQACLQVANTGPTASCKRISTQRAYYNI